VNVILPPSIQKPGEYVYPVQLSEAGVYMVRLSFGDEVIWKKLVKVQ
jgi:hypothetical protein